MKFRFYLFAVLMIFGLGLQAQDIPPKPNPPRLVNDLAGSMSADEVARLEQKLVAYDDSTSNQITIVTVRTLNDYPIEEYALKLFRDWGIGNKSTNNGVLILAAIDDHKLRIEVGYGLEGAIPDITANQIIRSDLTPNFRKGDFYAGFDAASESLIRAAAGEYTPPAGYADRGKGGKGVGGIAVVIFIIIVIILSNIGRGGGGGFMSRRGYRGFGPIFWPGGGGGWSGGGGGGWSGGGGGFGGFGGGSSGGGGASGGW